MEESCGEAKLSELEGKIVLEVTILSRHASAAFKQQIETWQCEFDLSSIILVLDTKEFTKPLLEKLISISAFMLVGARHPGATVGMVEKEHRDEAVSLIKELAAGAKSEKGTKFDAGVEERLLAYARSVAHFPTAVKEFEGRNGWFYSLSQRALANGQSDPLPQHYVWLKEVGAIKD